MRQKVGKERSQGVFAPLANPHRFLACPLRKFGLPPTPLRLCKTPIGVPSGTATVGRTPRSHPRLQAATFASAHLRPPLAATLPIPGGNATDDRSHGRGCTADGARRNGSTGSGHWYRPRSTTNCTRCCRRPTTLLRRSRERPGPGISLRSPDDGPSPPPATGPQHSLRSFAPAQATDRKTARPTVSVRAPWEIIPDKLTVYRVDFLLRRGARDFSLHFATQTQQSPCGVARHSKAGVGSATSYDCPTRAAAKAGITPVKHPTGAPGGRCLPALGIGRPGEKNAEKPPTGASGTRTGENGVKNKRFLAFDRWSSQGNASTNKTLPSKKSSIPPVHSTGLRRYVSSVRLVRPLRRNLRSAAFPASASRSCRRWPHSGLRSPATRAGAVWHAPA